jgi:hypothetical protein
MRSMSDYLLIGMFSGALVGLIFTALLVAFVFIERAL